MGMLFSEWYSPPRYDAELMYYQWRAYEAQVEQALNQGRLFPYWYDIQKRIEDLRAMQSFREDISRGQAEELGHDPIVHLAELTEQALETLNRLDHLGRDIRQEILTGLEVEQDELQPRSPLSGVLFFSSEDCYRARAFAYHYKGYTSLSPQSNIRLEYLGSHDLNGLDTGRLRMEYVRHRNLQTLPSSFHFHSRVTHPFYPSILPLIKELMTHQLQDASLYNRW